MREGFAREAYVNELSSSRVNSYTVHYTKHVTYRGGGRDEGPVKRKCAKAQPSRREHTG